MYKIGVFDSGVGGITVAKPILKAGIVRQIIYYGDTARLPYGTKTSKEIKRYSLDALEFFRPFDIDGLIVACNSASAHAIKILNLKAKFPVVGVIDAGVLALKRLNFKSDSRILVIGTNATINSKIYQKKLRKNGFYNVDAIATPLLVPIIEEGLFGTTILKEALKFYFSKVQAPDTIILGCTHFPLIAKEISEFFPQAKLIHSGEAIVEFLRDNKLLKDKAHYQNTSLKLFASDKDKEFRSTARKWLKY